MFTVKFISYFDNTQSENCLECPNYEVHQDNNGNYNIHCYKDFTNVDGVERWVFDEGWAKAQDRNMPIRYWHVCYVQNEAGKTIATYRPPIYESLTNEAA